MKLNNLHDVLVDNLRDLYNAEKQLIKALPKLAKTATAPDLRDAFQEHLAVTQEHAHRLEEIFNELEEKPGGKHCSAMEGLIEEGSEVIKESKNSDADAIDAALIVAAQKVEHYEMSGYGSARTFAKHLGFSHIAELLQQTLDEESETDEKLSQLAESHINSQAAHGGDRSNHDGDDSMEDRDYDYEGVAVSRAGVGRSRSTSGSGRSASRSNGGSRSGSRSRSGSSRGRTRR